MSQPRRRRRRRRRSGQPSDGARAQGQAKASPPQQDETTVRRRRRRGRRGRAQERQSASPTSSEDLVRALPQDRPQTLSTPPDGQDLDEIIRELQSVWGVPQYPQEYRITVKIAEERDGRTESTVVMEDGKGPNEGRPPGETGMPIREKAPAAPIVRNRDGAPPREKASRRRRRRRRGRGGGGSG